MCQIYINQYFWCQGKKCLIDRFTDKTTPTPQEVRQITSRFDPRTIDTMHRFKWLGHILRTGPSRITFQEVVEQRRLGLGTSWQSTHGYPLYLKSQIWWRCQRIGVFGESCKNDRVIHPSETLRLIGQLTVLDNNSNLYWKHNETQNERKTRSCHWLID